MVTDRPDRSIRHNLRQEATLWIRKEVKGRQLCLRARLGRIVRQRILARWSDGRR